MEPILHDSVLDLLLGPQLVAVATLLLAAVDCPGVKTCIALAADHLVLVVLAGERLKRGFNDATAETEDEVEGGLLLDVVVSKGAAILKLLPGEDQALLVRRDAFLVLDLGLDIVDGVAALDLEGDGLPRQGLHEDLHLALPGLPPKPLTSSCAAAAARRLGLER